MNTFTSGEFKTLASLQGERCVSIYLPRHGSALKTRQDQLRLKNLLGRAEKQMLAEGVRSTQALSLLEPGRRILEDDFFWRRASDGVALFLAPQFSRAYRVPLELDESLMLGRQFHLIPLVPFLSDDRYYILALSQNQVKLFHGTRLGVSQVEVRHMPSSLADAMKDIETERETDYHQIASPVGMGMVAMRFGNAAGTDDRKTRLLEYFHKIDDGLREMLGNQRVPLVLAGVDHLFPIYVEANTYPHLARERIAGSPKEFGTRELHERAWAIVQPSLAKKQDEAITRYTRNIGSERASSDLQQIVPMAHQGRVETLLVTRGLQTWGRYDANAPQVLSHKQFEPGDDDLLNLVAIQTLLHGGQVYLLERNRMPEHVTVAGLFR